MMTFLLLRLLLITLVGIWIAGAQSCPQKCQCRKSLTIVDCRNRGLVNIPSQFPSNVIEITLDKNAFGMIPAKAFVSAPNLQRLSMKSCSIDSIDPAAFTDLKNLSLLSMTGNLLKSTDYDTIICDQLPQLKTLLMGQNRMTEIPNLMKCKNLMKLGLEGNRLTRLNFPQGFEQLKKLSTLVLSNNKIDVLHRNDLEGLGTVRVFDLSRARVKSVEKGAFSQLSSLKSLKLPYNLFNVTVLKTILSDIANLPLVSLNLGGLSLGKFTTVPFDLFQSFEETPLTTLIFSHTPLVALPESFFRPIPRLTVLQLVKCQIRNIAQNTFKPLSKLHTLSLGRNSLTTIPIYLPSTLNWLSLAGNQITKIENQLFDQLKSLKNLFLEKNVILKVYQNAFAGLEHLEILDLADNKIDGAAILTFSPLRRLKKLILKDNSLRFPTNKLFEKLQSLEFLDLSSNKCPHIPAGSFSNLNRLVTLNLEHNDLGESLSSDTGGGIFTGLRSLKKLQLADNNIVVINNNLFSGMPNITEIQLQLNYITHWGDAAFHKNAQLQTLDLSHNSISIFNGSSMHDLNNTLDTLDLTNNPFACTCDLVWFRNWLNTSKIHFLNLPKYTCKSPPKFNGKRLLDFDPNSINCSSNLIQIVTSSVAGGVLIIVILMFTSYRYRWFIKLRFYRIKRKLHVSAEYEPIIGQDLCWTAFISYCHKSERDTTWIEETLLPHFDKGPRIRESGDSDTTYNGKYDLCFGKRDFTEGGPVTKSITTHVNCSPRGIVILTKDYLKSARCEMELYFLVDESIERDFSIVIVTLEPLTANDIPKSLQRSFEKGDHLEWNDQDRDQQGVFLTRMENKLGSRVPLRDSQIT